MHQHHVTSDMQRKNQSTKILNLDLLRIWLDKWEVYFSGDEYKKYDKMVKISY